MGSMTKAIDMKDAEIKRLEQRLVNAYNDKIDLRAEIKYQKKELNDYLRWHNEDKAALEVLSDNEVTINDALNKLEAENAVYRERMEALFFEVGKHIYSRFYEFNEWFNADGTAKRIEE